MLRAAVLATAGAVLAAVVAVVVANNLSSGHPPSDLALPRLAPAGGKVQLSDFKGRPVVLTFFASWCVPCHQELPAIADVARSAVRSVAFVGVDVSDNPGSARSLVGASKVAFPVGVDPDYRVSGDVFHLVGLPSTVFLTREGKVVARVNGPVTAPQLQSWVHRLERT